MTTYKVLNLDGTPCHGGQGGAWSLPTKRADGSWEPGEWREVTGELVLCENGLHGCDGERQLVQWLGPLVCEMEYDGEVVLGEDKVLGRRARLTRIVETWNERTARLFVCDCAERVLPIFERELVDDSRPRVAIETARRYANGEATREELAASWDAAMDAARSAMAAASAAAMTAAWDAAMAAARSVSYAAWVAARDARDALVAAWDARAARDARDAWDAECDWQTERLRQYLNAEVTG